MILYFQDLGLTTTECSIIYGVLPLSNGLCKMIVGAVADKIQRHRELTLISALLSAVLMSLLAIVPPVDEKHLQEPKSNGTLHYLCSKPGNHSTAPRECLLYNASKLHQMVGKSGLGLQEWKKVKNDELNNSSDCSQTLNVSFNVDEGCFNTSISTAEILNAVENNEDGMNTLTCKLNCTRYPIEFLDPPQLEKEMYGKTFWMIFWIWFTSCNLQGSLWALFYGMIYAILGEKREDFGKQRMWGTIGALTTSVLSAVAMNKYGSVTPEITYTPCFIGYAVWTVIIGVTAMFFKVPHMTRNKTMTKDMLKLVKQPAISLLFVAVFVLGFLGGAADTFLFMFLKSLNASSFMFGVILFVKFFGEVPALYFSGRIMKRIGHIRCIYIVLLLKFVRFLGTSFITNPWWEVAFSGVSSVVFGIGFTAVSVYGSLITPLSMHATLQGTIQTIKFGLGKLPLDSSLI